MLACGISFLNLSSHGLGDQDGLSALDVCAGQSLPGIKVSTACIKAVRVVALAVSVVPAGKDQDCSEVLAELGRSVVQQCLKFGVGHLFLKSGCPGLNPLLLFPFLRLLSGLQLAHRSPTAA